MFEGCTEEEDPARKTQKEQQRKVRRIVPGT